MAWAPVIVAGITTLGSLLSSRHTHEIRPDPAVEAAVKNLHEFTSNVIRQLADADSTAKVQKDPRIYNDTEKKIFQSFLEGLKRMTFVYVLPEAYTRKRNVLFIGHVSVGKSSLINRLYGTQLKVAVGHETTEITAVAEIGNTIIWDAPGNNRDFSYYNADMLNFIHSVDLVLVLYNTSLSLVDRIFSTTFCVKRIPAAIFAVRTMCDTFSTLDQRTIDQEVALDRQFLQQQGAGDVRIFTTSARGGFENEQLKGALSS